MGRGAVARAHGPVRTARVLRRVTLPLLLAVSLIVPAAASSSAAGGALSFTTTPASPGSTRAPAWTFTAPGTAIVLCTLTDAGGAVIGTADCTSGSYTGDLIGQPDGTYTLRAAVQDANGASGTSAYTLDTVPPATPSISGPTGPSQQPSVTFTLSTPEPVAGWQCVVSGPSGTTTPTCAEGAWPVSFAVDGRYTLTVRTYDGAGHNSQAVTRTYTLDRTAPAAPGMTFTGAATPTTPSYTLTGEPGGTWTCTVTPPGGVATTTPCAAGSETFTLSGPNGVWTLTARQTDEIGNVGPLTAVYYTLDTIAPAAPTVTAPQSPSRSSTPTYSLYGESGATFSCTVSGPGGWTATPDCADGTVTLNLAGGDGTYAFSATQTDEAGNTGPATTSSYVLDSVNKTPDISGPSGPSNDATPVFAILGKPDATFSCTLTAPGGTPAAIGCNSGTISPDLTAGPDGLWTVTATQTDGTGETSAAGVAQYLLDRAKPAAPTVTGPFGPHPPTAPTYDVAGEDGATFTCALAGPAGTSSVACDSGLLTLDLSGPEGRYDLTVTQTDRAGNVSDPRFVSYLLDTVAPIAPTVTGPASPGSSTTPSYAVTGEDGATFECVVTGPAGWSATPACAAGTLTLDLTGGDGSYTLSVTQADANGNTSPPRTVEYELDTVTAAPGLTGPAGPSNDTTPVFAVTGETGATFACTLTPPGGTAAALDCADGTAGPDLSAGPDGTWTVTATQTDRTGTTSDASTRTYLLDTSAPAPPTVTRAIGPSPVREPRYDLAGEPDATLACTLTAPGGTPSAIACAPGVLTLDLPGADGSYQLAVTQTDLAGNTSDPRVVTYVLDTAAPAAPTVTGPASPGSSSTPSYQLYGETDAVFTCTVTGPAPWTGATPDCADGTVTLDLTGGDGSYTLSVTQTDPSGNTSPAKDVSYVLDSSTTAPDFTGPAGPSNDTAPEFAVTGEPGATFTCTLTAPGGTAEPLDCAAGTATPDLSAGPDGDWTLTATQTDLAGTTGDASTLHYLLDTEALAAGISGSTGPSFDVAPAFGITGEPGATFACTVTGPAAWSATPTCSAPTVTLDLTGGDGTYTLSVTQTDVAGNTSPPATTPYRLDTGVPAAPTVTGPLGPHTQRQPTYDLTAETGATLTCTLTGPGATPADPRVTTPLTCAPGLLTLDLTGPDGSYQLEVVQTDAAGNVSAPRPVDYLLDTVAPVAPTVTAPASPGSSTTPSYTLAGEPTATFDCTVTGPGGWSATPVCADGSVTLDLTGGDGTYTLTVVQHDANGNTSPPKTVEYDLDTVAAAPGLIGPAGPSSDTTPAFTVSGEPGAAFACTLTPPGGAATALDCADGSANPDLSVGPDGSWTVTATQTDPAGTTSDATTMTYLLDTSAPAAPTVTSAIGPTAPRQPQYDLAAGEPGATLSCTLTAPGAPASAIACAPGVLTLGLTGPDGTYQLAVTQTDATGNTSEATVVTYLLDTTAPAAPTVTAPTGPGGAFELAGEPGGTWTCTLTGPAGSSDVPCDAGALTLTLTEPGSHDLTVTQTDARGNASAPTVLTYELAPPPPPAPTPTPVVGPVVPSEPVVGPVLPSASPSPTPSPSATPTPPPANPRPPDPTFPAPPPPAVDTEPEASPSPVSSTTATEQEPDAEPAGYAERPAPRWTPTAAPRVLALAPAGTAPRRLDLARYGTTDRVAARPLLRSDSPAALDLGRWRGALRLATSAGTHGGPPILLLLLAIAFLAVQDRIDRNDPKLALAPVHRHQRLAFRRNERETP